MRLLVQIDTGTRATIVRVNRPKSPSTLYQWYKYQENTTKRLTGYSKKRNKALSATIDQKHGTGPLSNR